MQYTFSTDCRDEARQLFICGKASSAVWEFDQWLRALVKWQPEDKAPPTLDEVRQKLHDCFLEEGISLDDFVF